MCRWSLADVFGSNRNLSFSCLTFPETEEQICDITDELNPFKGVRIEEEKDQQEETGEDKVSVFEAWSNSLQKQKDGCGCNL